mmetsp:Transcript_4998/g.10795  ORF Transcript_4998/g.10795 Transcript_4998/m.10795 type:complete len:318 (+) Transcript_4998:38-991(+)
MALRNRICSIGASFFSRAQGSRALGPILDQQVLKPIDEQSAALISSKYGPSTAHLLHTCSCSCHHCQSTAISPTVVGGMLSTVRSESCRLQTPYNFIPARLASSDASTSNEKDKATEGRPGAASDAKPEGDSAAADAETPSVDEMLAQLKDKESAAEKLAGQVEQLTDSLKRSLAEMENVRMRAQREVDSAKKFASQPLVKSLLDVPDNLERAAASVPAEALREESTMDTAKLRSLLKGLLEGMQATEKIMLGILNKHGVEQYNPINEKFDPNLHNALFEVADPTKEVGTIAVVTKRGYKLHDRVIRPAEVGVVRSS